MCLFFCMKNFLVKEGSLLCLVQAHVSYVPLCSSLSCQFLNIRESSLFHLGVIEFQPVILVVALSYPANIMSAISTHSLMSENCNEFILTSVIRIFERFRLSVNMHRSGTRGFISCGSGCRCCGSG